MSKAKMNTVRNCNTVLTNYDHDMEEVHLTSEKAQQLLMALRNKQALVEGTTIEDGLLSAIDMLMTGNMEFQAQLIQLVLGVEVEIQRKDDEDYADIIYK